MNNSNKLLFMELENVSEVSEVTVQDHNATPVSPLIGDYKYHFFDMDWAKSNAKEKEKKKLRKLGKQKHWRSKKRKRKKTKKSRKSGKNKHWRSKKKSKKSKKIKKRHHKPSSSS